MKDSEFTPAKLNKLVVADLKKMLAERGLSTDGLKKDLVARLVEHAESSGEVSPLIAFYLCIYL